MTLTCPDRGGTWSFKWDRFGPGILPLWVADLDYAAPPAVLEALRARCDHGILGYTGTPPAFGRALAGWLERHHAWVIDPAWVVPFPGTMVAAACAARALGHEGEAGLLTTPLYPPLVRTPDQAGRRALRVPLAETAHGFVIDWPALEAAAAEARVLWWCSPHNPTGRVWTEEEHDRLEALILRHDLWVVSDEIWMDLVLEPGLRHRPLGLRPALAARTITLTAPSKTFNLPGLGCAAAIIPDRTLRQRIQTVGGGLVPHVTLPGLIGAIAAWDHGDPWRQDLLPVLRHHRDALVPALRAAGLRCHVPEATYLLWSEASRWGPAPMSVALAAGLGPSDGQDFAAPGWLRWNLGFRPSLLPEVLRRVAAAARGGPTPPVGP